MPHPPCHLTVHSAEVVKSFASRLISPLRAPDLFCSALLQFFRRLGHSRRSCLPAACSRPFIVLYLVKRPCPTLPELEPVRPFFPAGRPCALPDHTAKSHFTVSTAPAGSFYLKAQAPLSFFLIFFLLSRFFFLLPVGRASSFVRRGGDEGFDVFFPPLFRPFWFFLISSPADPSAPSRFLPSSTLSFKEHHLNDSARAYSAYSRRFHCCS